MARSLNGDADCAEDAELDRMIVDLVEEIGASAIPLEIGLLSRKLQSLIQARDEKQDEPLPH